MVIDPASTYFQLGQDGSCAHLPGGAAFWSRKDLAAIGKDWLVSEFTYTEDWSNWEMHPAGDEVVYLLEGHISLLLDMPAGQQEITVRDRGAVVVPKGIWHTARVTAPSRVLHITMGNGTQSRPAD